MLCITGLPEGSEECNFREFLGHRLDTELLGLIYYCTLEQSGTTCFLNFITHKAMKDARNVLKNSNYRGSKLRIEAAYDITRTELVNTSLGKSLGEEDEAPPLSFFLSNSDVRVNLVIMMMVWLITVFDFYLIGFLVNTFE